MAAYLIADVRIDDADRMAHYRVLSSVAMREHGAQVLVRGGPVECLEGDAAPERVVVLRFADRAAARAFYESPSYRAARQVRAGAGSIRMLLVDGAASEQPG